MASRWLMAAVVSLALLLNSAAQRFGRPLHPVAGPRPGSPGYDGPGPNYPSYGDSEGLGAPCDYDEDCYSMEHTYCRNQQSCECKRGFEPSAAGDRCMATVGARCSTKYDCSGLSSAGECSQGVCTCGPKHVPVPDGSCLKGALRMNDPCEEALQCELLGDGATCERGRCQCATGMHAYRDKCRTNRGLHESCTEDGDCFIGEAYEGVIVCHKSTSTCQCREHYVDHSDGKCASANKVNTALTTVGLGLLILLIA